MDMKIAVMGAGAIGGYYGARLQAAGNEVHFLARGRHLAALRSEGLRLDSALGNLHLQSVRATDRAEEVGPAELVLFAVKLYDVETAAAACRPLLGPDCAVLPLENGVDAAERIGAVLGMGFVLAATTYIGSRLVGPGAIQHNGKFARIVFGELSGERSARAERILAVLQAAGIEAVLSPDIRRALWEKFVFLVPHAGLTALTRLPIGRVRAAAETRALLIAVIEESVTVGRAEGIALAADCAGKTLALIDSLPAGMGSSLLQDLERGGRLELDWLAGAVAQKGAARGIATPACDFLIAALRPHVNGGQG
jgi:2-dehydropantoate 2-reductase